MAANISERDASFRLTDDKLDELFIKEVDSVTKIVEQLPKNDVLLSIWSRWFKIFQKAKPNEKFARNYMLLLLHHQLNEGNTLGFPFTDARSFQRDLITLHKMSMTLQQKKSVDDESSGRSACSSAKSNIEKSSSSSHSHWNSDIDVQQLKQVNKQLMEENDLLVRQVQALLVKKKSLLKRQWDCKNEMDNMRDKSAMYAKELSYMKYIFSCSIVTSLQLFHPSQTPPLTKEPIYFITLFNVLCENDEDRAKIQDLDQQFGKLLRGNIDHNMRKAMLLQLEKEYDKLKEKASKHYKEVVKNEEETQLKNLTIMASKYFMVLNNLFADTFKGHKRVRKKVLKYLQQYIEQAKDM